MVSFFFGNGNCGGRREKMTRQGGGAREKERERVRFLEGEGLHQASVISD